MQTLEGHAQNVSCVSYHPELPIIMTGSEDGKLSFCFVVSRAFLFVVIYLCLTSGDFCMAFVKSLFVTLLTRPEKVDGFPTHQGSSRKIILFFSSQGKVRESEENASNQGKVREFCFLEMLGTLLNHFSLEFAGEVIT